jgi:hypothetical protein
MKDWLTVNNSGCAAFDIRQARFQDDPNDRRGGSFRRVDQADAHVEDNRATA